MSLKRHCRRVVETFGLQHVTMLRALRLYIKTHTEEELIKEIKDTKEAPCLKALWEAGLSQPLQDAVLEQIRKIS